ncbi:hypothetical protein EYV94_22755 [Puteibacter caeruleilacunae]|nr:hypothetical protein EYV94_22755 [Puteibacter caeruleilacunae]
MRNKKSKVEKIIANKWIKILIISALAWMVISFSIYHVVSYYTRNFHSPTMKDKYYLFDATGKLDEPYGVSYKKDINNLIDFCNSKLYDQQYTHHDISVLNKLKNNQIVYLQSYLRDSSIAVVSYKQYHTQRKDSIMLELYIPSVFLHKKPH